MKKNACEAGFTLIELMITVVVVAILASIAIPSYTEYVRRGARAEAMAALLQAAARMQQGYTLTNSYSAGAPASFAGTTKYAVSLSGAVTNNTYMLQASPAAGYSDAKCGTFTIDQSGSRGLSGSHTASVADCWSGK